MIAAVIDTHAIIWYIYANPRLSHSALNFIQNSATNAQQIGISSITMIEMIYLIEKGKIPVEAFSRLVHALQSERGVFIEIPVNLDIARTLNHVDAAKVPDMPDRVIAATALYLNVPVISKDSKIQLSGLTTIW